jgi:serine/threonine protein kinase
MPKEPSTLPEAEATIDQVIRDYLKAIDEGQTPDRQELLVAHPTLAGELQAFFAAQDRAIPMAAALRRLAPASAANEPLPEPFGDYEVIEEIGHGGMGIVYRVRDSDLDRNLAIKVLRPDRRGILQYEQRFQEEAQILGQLQHPGIVPIHNRGHLPDGRPFFTMKLVMGQTLAALLHERETNRQSDPGGPADLPRLLTIFEQVCQTMAYAHSRRVIHRDLKPLNIMVGAFAEVQVMDWGLAKVLLSREASAPDAMPVPVIPEAISEVRPALGDTPRISTQAGDAMGTWAYMPPEQARGEVDQLDERCDVFSLGAILCELLTGLPPRASPTRTDLIDQAKQGDLADAEARLGDCGADAELVELAQKCLAGDRGQRPRDANAVAQAVTAYQAGVQERLRQAELDRAAAEVKAREERKRRRIRLALQGSMVLLLLALIAGTAFSVYFAIDADQQADQARNKKTEAERNADTAQKNEADAVKAKNKLQTANQELERYRDELEATLARSLVAPLGLQEHQPLTDPEIEAIWQLAGTSGDRLGPRFVEEALRDRVKTGQLRARAQPALSAASGLSELRRAKIERLLAERLQSPDSDDQKRTDVAGAAAALGGLTPTVATPVADILIHAIAKTKEPHVYRDLAERFLTVAQYLDPNGAQEVSQILMQHLIAHSEVFTQGLSVLAVRMEPQQAADVIIEAVLRNRGYFANLRATLLAAVARLNPRRASETLLQALAKTGGTRANTRRGQFADPVVDGLAEVLQTVFARLGPEDAARYSARAADTLIDDMVKSTYVVGFQGFLAVAPSLDPKSARRVAESLLRSKRNIADVGRLAHCLSVVVPRLDSNEATRLYAQRADFLPGAAVFSPDYLHASARALMAFATRLDPEAAGRVRAQAADYLTRALSGADQDPDKQSRLAQDLSGLAQRLEPKEASRVCTEACKIIILDLSQPFPPERLPKSLQSLSALASHLEPKDAIQTCESVIERMTGRPNNTDQLVQALAAVAQHLDSMAAARQYVRAAGHLTQTMAKMASAMYPVECTALTKPLSFVVSFLELREARRFSRQAAYTVVQGMTAASAETAKSPADSLHYWSEALVTIVPWLHPKDASRHCGQAARIIAPELIKAHGTYQPAQYLCSVAAYLDPKDASDVAGILIQAIDRNKSPNGLAELLASVELGQGLSAVAARLEPKQAAPLQAKAWGLALTALTRQIAMTEGRLTFAYPVLHRLSMMASRIEQKDAARAAVILSKAMAKMDTMAGGLPQLAQILVAVTTRLGPKEASALRAEAAITLIQAMSKASNTPTLTELSEGLFTLLARLEPKDEEQLVETLLQAGANGAVLQGHPHLVPDQERRQLRDVFTTLMARALAVILMRVDQDELGRRAKAVASGLSLRLSTRNLYSPVVLMAPAVDPPPCRLATPELVELLKHPTCLGPARRVILDQLENRYQHKFADHWAFVRFAKKQKLDLDFTSPPKRRVLLANGQKR